MKISLKFGNRFEEKTRKSIGKFSISLFENDTFES